MTKAQAKSLEAGDRLWDDMYQRAYVVMRVEPELRGVIVAPAKEPEEEELILWDSAQEFRIDRRWPYIAQ